MFLSGFQYNFEGRYDLVRFVKTIKKAGLYAHLRIGPYVCAEWNFGYKFSILLLRSKLQTITLHTHTHTVQHFDLRS